MRFPFLFFISLFNVLVFSSNVKFKSYDIRSGLSNNTVYGICQDRRGFIWMATDFGLNRFDGNNMKQYLTDEAGGILGCHAVYCIKTDPRDGKIWMGTDRGLAQIDPETDSLKLFDRTTAEGKRITGAVKNLCFDRNGNLWIHNYPHIYVFRCERDDLEQVDLGYHDEKNGIIPPGAIWIDSQDNTLWVAWHNWGIGCLEEGQTKPHLVARAPGAQLVMKGYGRDSLIVGTISNGLWVIDKKGRSIRQIKAVDGIDVGHIYVNDILFDKEQVGWICTLTGIYLLEKGRITQHISHERMNPYALADNHVLTAFEDRDGNMWLGFKMSGVGCHFKRADNFMLYHPYRAFYDRQSVKALEFDSQGRLWVGMEEGGLGWYELNTLRTDGIYGHSAVFNIQKMPELQCKVYALKVLGDELWIGTYTKGLYVYNMKHHSFKHYFKDNQPYSLYNNEIYEIFIDSHQRVWVGTTTTLFEYDRQTERFNAIMDGLFVKAIAEDTHGMIWIATADRGLVRYNPSDSQTQFFNYNPNNSNSLCYGALSDILCDSKGYLWISSENGGICRYNSDKKTFTRVMQRNGLQSDVIYKMLDDGNGTIWLSTNRGLAALDMTDMRVKVTFDEHSVLPAKQFMTGSGILSPYGALCFGSTDGIVIFKPEDVMPEDKCFRVYITDIYRYGTGGKIETIMSETGNKGDGQKLIKMSYDKASFTVRFSALDFERANTGYYAYMMEGLDEGWTVRKHIDELSYHRLAPGHYILHIKYSPDGLRWEARPSVLRIVVTPPIWLTWPAWILYVMIAVAGCWLVLKKINERRKRKVHYQRMMWEKQKNEELYNAKLDFFTAVAHEIRTPVTLVKAPVESMMARPDCPEAIRKGLDVVARNIRRLNVMTDRLLDFRRLESGSWNLVPKKLDMRAMASMVCAPFIYTARERQVELSLDTGTDPLMVWADEEAMISVMDNLVGNAMKYARNRILVEVGKEPGNVESVCFRVSNDGELVAENIRDRIFEPFVRGEHATVKGSGIGLALASALAMRMGGRLGLEVKDGLNVFELRLPLIMADNQMRTDKGMVQEIEKQADEAIEDNDKPVILIVDDQLELLDFMATELSADYIVRTAANGETAYSMLLQEEMDLVVSDVMMPVMDGYELCRMIKQNVQTCHIPVILLTAKVLVQNKIEGIESGADAYVDKPFSMDCLRSWIKGLIENRRRVKERMQHEPLGDVIASGGSPVDRQFIEQVKELVRSEMDDDDFNVDHLAESMNMSRSSFHRKIKGLTGLTPGEFVLSVRLDYAASLLADGHCRVTEAAEMAGFKSLSHFSRSFLKKFGVSPSHYVTGK